MSDMGELITVTGNVGTAPELKRTNAGVPITTFRLARGLRRYDRDAGAWADVGTNWYTVSVFRDLGDHAFASLRKGDRVIVTGRLRVRDWEAGTAKGTAVEIEADAIGHDLRWGTTTFVKDSRSAAHHADRPAPTPDDAWAAPGLDREDAADGALPADGTLPADGALQPMVLVPDAGDDATDVGGEPPF